MLRQLLLRASNNEQLRHLATSNRIANSQARRFVAGETIEDARTAARTLVDAGRWVSLDHVGEEVTTRDEAIAAADHYVEALGVLAADGLTGRVGVSVKPTQIGLRIDDGLCREQIARIAAASAPGMSQPQGPASTGSAPGGDDPGQHDGAHVTLDMEDHTVTDATLDMVESLRADGHDHVGCAVQVMLHRTRDDVVRMVEQGVSLRLCKGAYAEPQAHAMQDATRIRDRYLALADLMLAGGGLPRFATHDHEIIGSLRSLGRTRGTRSPASPDVPDMEFQLLHGVRESLQEELVEAGLRTLVYLPYGDEWYPYFVRRLAERPANLLFFLRAMTRA